MKRALLLSLAFHLLLLLFFIPLTSKGMKQQEQLNIELTEPSQASVEEKIAEKEAGASSVACGGGKWYGGIGITTTAGVITQVIHGYPADKAGLETGDLIASNLEDIRGEPGTVAKVVVIKLDGNTLRYNIQRDKICLER